MKTLYVVVTREGMAKRRAQASLIKELLHDSVHTFGLLLLEVCSGPDACRLQVEFVAHSGW